ncbi:hypothetical protein D3C72_1318920 [compost metagenome]
MCERVGAHHGLVGLHHEAGGLADHAAGGHDVLGVDVQVEPEVVPARLHGHDHFFERAIACALSQAVDRALDLARAADLHAGQRVRHGHAQVVVAMHRPDRLVAVGNALAQHLDEVAVQLRNGVADGVGHVDGGGALVDHGLEHAAQEVGVAAVAVFGAELDVGDLVAREAHGQLGLLMHLVGRHAQLLLHVQRRGRDEGVDAPTRRALQGLGRARDVAVVGTRQAAHRRVLDRVGDGLHGLEVAVRTGRKAGFDDVDPEPLQQLGDAQFFVARHRGAGRLFAVAQSGVENNELVGHRGSPWFVPTLRVRLVPERQATSATDCALRAPRPLARCTPDTIAFSEAEITFASMPTPNSVCDSSTRSSR